MTNRKASEHKLNYVCVCFVVDDVVKSAEYYRDVLGFSFNRYWGEPPCFVMLERDGVQFFLSGNGTKGHVRPNRMNHARTGSDVLRNEGIRVEGFERLPHLSRTGYDPWRSRGCLNGVHFLPASL